MRTSLVLTLLFSVSVLAPPAISCAFFPSDPGKQAQQPCDSDQQDQDESDLESESDDAELLVEVLELQQQLPHAACTDTVATLGALPRVVLLELIAPRPPPA